jgi:hypothetical protein
MTYLNDTLTIGLVLVLLFGSIALYLYTCIQQSEQKISLLESILLDIKMSGEIKSYTELPADDAATNTPNNSPNASSHTDDTYAPFDEEKEIVVEEADDTVIDVDGDLEEKLNEAAEYQAAVSDAIEEVASSPKAYDADPKAYDADPKAYDADPKASADPKAYDSMSLKELQALAKSRGIVGLTKKGPLMEALKTSDRSQVKPGSIGAVGTNSFLESSASVSDESS